MNSIFLILKITLGIAVLVSIGFLMRKTVKNSIVNSGGTIFNKNANISMDTIANNSQPNFQQLSAEAKKVWEQQRSIKPEFMKLIKYRIKENSFLTKDAIAIFGKPDKERTHLNTTFQEALINNLSGREPILKTYDYKTLTVLSYECGIVNGCSESIHFVYSDESPDNILAAVKWVACPE